MQPCRQTHLVSEEVELDGGVETQRQHGGGQLPGLAREECPEERIGRLGVDPAPAGLVKVGVVAQHVT